MTDTPPREDFLAQLGTSVRDGSFVKLTLGKPRGTDPTPGFAASSDHA